METENLKHCLLFKGMEDNEIKEACRGLKGMEKKFSKGSFVLSAGEPTERLGLVLSGSVTIENNDLWGNRTILSMVQKNGFFAESYAILGQEPVLVDVVANEDVTIAFFYIHQLVRQAAFRNSWEIKMIRNLLMITTQKNLVLSRRSFHISPKSIRARIMSYLNTVSIRRSANEFDIPFDRQQLADYLNVDRTALSKELGRMRNEGILEFRKNHFKIISDPDL